MNIDQLRERFPDETACRKFFESVIWVHGRRCPHCGHDKSYRLRTASLPPGAYECARCRKRFRVTTKTPMHSTKLPLWKWIMAMYSIINSSKGISSVFLARWIGVSQPTAWKLGHAIREMMAPHGQLNGVVELDEKYVGGKPRRDKDLPHKRGKGTNKQQVLIAVERNGSVRSIPVDDNKITTLAPLVTSFISRNADLMTDKHPSYRSIGSWYQTHSHVNHGQGQYSSGAIHTNTAESFGALLERAKFGVFHYLSKAHLHRYLHEIGFRWNHREPKEHVTKTGKKKTILVPLSIIETLASLIAGCTGKQLRRTENRGIRSLHPENIFNSVPYFCS